MTIRDRIRAWLGVKDYNDDLSAHSAAIGVLESDCQRLTAELATEHNWRTSFVDAMKTKSERKSVPRYTDYESSQILALDDFKEKN